MDPTTPGAEAAGDLKGWRLAERHDALLDFESIMIGCGLLWLRPSPEFHGIEYEVVNCSSPVYLGGRR